MTVYDLERIQLPVLPSEFRDRDDSADTHFVPAPCQVACPIGTDAPSYIGYIWEGKLEEAFEAITATNPFSSICGRDFNLVSIITVCITRIIVIRSL